MEINLLEKMNNSTKLDLEKNSVELNLESEQKSFLQTNLGQTINKGINIGLRAVLPDCIEEQIIEVKDALITEGFSEALDKAVDIAISFEKSTIGIFTGEFENISQIETAIEEGGIVDKVSSLLDGAIEFAKLNNWISSNIANSIKAGKNILLDNVKDNIGIGLNEQVKKIDDLSKNIDNWNKYYKENDFINMEKQYQIITEQLNNTLPLEKQLKKLENCKIFTI